MPVRNDVLAASRRFLHAQAKSTEGIWRTTEDGSKIFISNEGEVRAGGPAGKVLSSKDSQGDKQSSKPKASKASPKVLAWAQERFKDETKARNFAEWFGDSKVVDADGNPQVVYHGTTKKFDAFSDEKLSGGTLGVGHYFAKSEAHAKLIHRIQSKKQGATGGEIKQAFIKASNPLEMTDLPPGGVSTKKVADAGYDAITYRNEILVIKASDIWIDQSIGIGSDAEKSLLAASKRHLASQSKSTDQADGVWRTTEDGSRIFIDGSGEARAGGPKGEKIDSPETNEPPKQAIVDRLAASSPVAGAPTGKPGQKVEVPGARGPVTITLGSLEGKRFNDFANPNVAVPKADVEIVPLKDFVPREPVREKPDMAAHIELAELASKHGVKEPSSAASIFQRWVSMGMADQMGITPEIATKAAELKERATGRVTHDTSYRDDDDYLYHVTTKPAATDIKRGGLQFGKDANFSGYEAHSAGRVFLTERSGVEFWQEKVGEATQNFANRKPKLAVVRVKKESIHGTIRTDREGTRDAPGVAYFVEQEGRGSGQKSLFGLRAMRRWAGEFKAKSATDTGGVWRTTEDGNKIFIESGGDVRAGGPGGPVIASKPATKQPKRGDSRPANESKTGKQRGDKKSGKAWMPSMTKAEAGEFTANSAIKKEVTHVTTSKEAADSIASEGFKLSGRLGGKIFGDGVYLGTDSTTTKFYQKYIGESYESPVTLKLRVNVQNPLRVNVGEWNSLQVQREVLPRQVAKQAGLASEYAANASEMNATNRRILKEYKKSEHGTLDQHKRRNGWADDVPAQAVRKTLESAGYDSVEIVDKRFRSDVGGNQLIVFDPKRVTVIKTDATKKPKSLAKSCGANATGGGGFQTGNTCAEGGGGGGGTATKPKKKPEKQSIANRVRNWFKGEPARQQLQEKLAGPLDDQNLKNAEKFREAIEKATGRMPESVAKLAMEGVKDVEFFDTARDLTKRAIELHPEMAADIPEGSVIAGLYTDKGQLLLNGGKETGDNADATHGTYLHELVHAMDPGDKVAFSDDWLLAWGREMRKGQLTEYGASSPVEGLAEFGRVLYDNGDDAVRKQYPKAYDVFKSQGWTK